MVCVWLQPELVLTSIVNFVHKRGKENKVCLLVPCYMHVRCVLCVSLFVCVYVRILCLCVHPRFLRLLFAPLLCP